MGIPYTTIDKYAPIYNLHVSTCKCQKLAHIHVHVYTELKVQHMHVHGLAQFYMYKNIITCNYSPVAAAA